MNRPQSAHPHSSGKPPTQAAATSKIRKQEQEPASTEVTEIEATATGKIRKQEQEPASTEVTEVAPGVLRMQLPVSMPGLGHVNCYALIDSDGAALVDPGLPGKESWSALLDRLRKAEIPLARVHTVIVTHSHPDHFGGSHQLLAETGAALVTHTAFSSNPAITDANADLDLDLLAIDRDELVELWQGEGTSAGSHTLGHPP